VKTVNLYILAIVLVCSLSLAHTNPFLIDTNVVYRPTPGGQSYPTIAFDGTNYFVIWHDMRNWVSSYHGEATAYWHIYGCRVNPQGILLDSAGISISYYIHMVYPIVPIPVPPGMAYGNGVFLATWSDYRGFEAGIYGARIDTNGTVLDPDGFMISDNYTWANTSVAYDGANLLVTWATAAGVYGCRVTPEGVILDPDGITVSNLGECLSVSVAFDGTNYFVVWGTWTDIYGARVDTAGNVLDTFPIPVCTTPGDQSYASVTFGGTDYFVVWVDSPSSNYADIYGARVSPAGMVIDTNGFAISTLPEAETDPSVTFDGVNYLVVWFGSAIYCARVDTCGLLLDTTAVSVYQNPNNPFGAPSVDFDGTNYFAAWYNYTYEGDGDIFGARVDTSGVVIDTTAILLSLSAYPGRASAAVFDETNYFAVWTDYQDTSDTFIYGTRIDTSGTILDPQCINLVKGREPSIAFDGANYLLLCSDIDIKGVRVDPEGTIFDTMTIFSIAPDRCNDPAVIFDGTNYFAAFVAWLYSYGPYIYGLRIDTAGVVLDTVPTVMSHGGAYDLNPAVSFDGTNYLVVWFHGTHESTFDVYGARVTTSGVLLDTVPLLIATGTYRQWFPSVAFDGTNYFVVWQDNRNGVYGDIYGTGVTPSGVVLDPSGIPICTATSGQYNPKISFDGQNYCVVWEDWRNGNYTDIYGCYVTPGGQVIEEFVVSDQPNLQLEPNLTRGLDKYLITYSGFVDSINGRPTNTLRIWGEFRQFTGIMDGTQTKTQVTSFGLRVSPNPVHQECIIKYSIPTKTRIQISMYDVTGRLSRELINEIQDVGIYRKTIDMTSLPQGVYFVKLYTSNKSKIQKIVLLK
jgi:hypothetical protein